MKKLFVFLLCTLAFATVTVAQPAEHVLSDTLGLEEVKINGSLSHLRGAPFSTVELSGDMLRCPSNSEAACVLSKTPSITYQSDNGSNMGYLYFRLRGIDQARLNITVNGVPINEPEDQGSYLNNFPNFMSSVRSLQVIRGAGMTKSGVSPFAGSINFQTLENWKDRPTVTIGGGSYGTQFTDVIAGGSSFFARIGQHRTNGFKRNSFNESIGASYGGKIDFSAGNLSFFGMIGSQRNGMAWVGETKESLRLDPRHNSNLPWETDNFLNVHNQLSWNATHSEESSIRFTVFHQYQDGWYDTDMSLFYPDYEKKQWMSRIGLDFNWWGVQYNHSIRISELLINWGVTYNRHVRNHSGYDDYDEAGMKNSYENSGIKEEYTQYAKLTYDAGKFSVYCDVQNRYVNHSYSSLDTTFHFKNGNRVNFSGGVSYDIPNGIVRYAVSKNSREPRRSDVLGGFDAYFGERNNLLDERVLSQDVGIRVKSGDITWEANLFDMSFRNELMLTGTYGTNGISLYDNVRKSYRRGIEVWALREGKRITASFAATLSRNRFLHDEWRVPELPHDDVYGTSVMSPSFTSKASLEYKISKGFVIGSSVRYSSESFIDRENSIDDAVPGHSVLDAFCSIELGRVKTRLDVGNLSNSAKIVGGMVGFDGTPRYFTLGRTTAMITINIKI